MKYLYIAFCLVVLLACVSKPDFPIEPVITYKGMSSTSMRQGKSVEDSIKIFIHFTDGDGDLGAKESNQTNLDVFIIDKRTNLIQDKAKIPYIPPVGTGNGIEGDMELLVFTTCCLYEDGVASNCEPIPNFSNELVYEIYIKDRAGNESNHIYTDVITLRCN